MLIRLAWIFSLGFFISTLVSQSLMDFFSVLIVGLAAYISKKEKSNPFKTLDKRFLLLMVSWIVWVALTLIVNQVELKTSVLKLLEFKWILTLVGLTILIKKIFEDHANKNDSAIKLEKFLNIFGWGFLLTSAFAVLVYFLKFNPAHPGRVMDVVADGSVRSGGLLAQPIVFGHLQTVFLSFLTAYLILNFKNLKQKLFWVAVVSTGFFALVFSFTRGAWIGYVAALAVIIWFISKKAFVRSAVLGFFAMAMAYIFLPGFQSRVDFALMGGDLERIYIWKANFLMFQENPIFGVGYGENKNHMIEYYQRIGAPEGLLISHAHNQFLHFLAGTGFAGLIFYFLFLYYWLKTSLNSILQFKLLKSQSQVEQMHWALAVGCLASVASIIFGGLTEANFEHSKMVYAMICIWSFIFYFSKNFFKQLPRGEA